MKLPALDELLEFKNPEIIERYQRDYPNNKLSAEKALHEILKFFWAGQLHRKALAEHPDDEALQFRWLLHREMKEIDDMWHTFILFTKPYADFCDHYFGQFIHHFPTTDAEKEHFQTNIDEFLDKDTQRMLSFVYDHLGEETLRTWFSTHFAETA
ncbi:MAG: hypothetical protein KDH94_08380 [Coxiellaceae bacterium]|nr:hypothetical protein [Coxiellaceae bacterium]